MGGWGGQITASAWGFGGLGGAGAGAGPQSPRALRPGPAPAAPQPGLERASCPPLRPTAAARGCPDMRRSPRPSPAPSAAAQRRHRLSRMERRRALGPACGLRLPLAPAGRSRMLGAVHPLPRSPPAPGSWAPCVGFGGLRAMSTRALRAAPLASTSAGLGVLFVPPVLAFEGIDLHLPPMRTPRAPLPSSRPPPLRWFWGLGGLAPAL